ncbi:hypothetical protein Bca52824_019066 [Brassica carinata]|uniref:Uncharacterized protein n=1 Tax=Brassica carinata TaxID=52824 RepID=A0A8X7VQN3_BRACI|nr:hypothetical protein Bca52824_019066 [Brassica carinata]
MLDPQETLFGDLVVHTMPLPTISSPFHFFLLRQRVLGISACGSGMSLSEVAKLRSQPSELAVGLYSSNGHDRYEAITEIFANQ